MTHKFDIDRLTLEKPIEKFRQFYLVVKVSERYWFKTAEQHMNNLNIIPFMEQNEFTVPQDLMIYYSISLYEKTALGGKLIQRKMLFKKDIRQQTLQFRMDPQGNNNAFLHFKASVTKNAADTDLGVIGDRIRNHATHMAATPDASKLEILALGGLMYRFVNKLDIVVAINNYIRQVYHWKYPTHTILFGICLTFLILNPRLTLVILGILILWCRKIIFIAFENYSKRTYNRLVPPEQNLKLLQAYMSQFCQIYDNFKEMIYGDDKTEFILLLNSILAGAWVLVILPMFLGVDIILVIILWGGLLVGKDVTKLLLESMQNIHRTSVQQWFARFQNSWIFQLPTVTKIILFLEDKLPGATQVNVRKTFYVYEFQRWWMGNWGQPSGSEHKWSDQSGKLIVLPRKQPPQNYYWATQWKILTKTEETDEQGYKYASDFLQSFHKEKGLFDVIRRRKWIRRCFTNRSRQSPTMIPFK